MRCRRRRAAAEAHPPPELACTAQHSELNAIERQCMALTRGKQLRLEKIYLNCDRQESNVAKFSSSFKKSP
jgi:hypothetical protein